MEPKGYDIKTTRREMPKHLPDSRPPTMPENPGSSPKIAIIL